MIPIEFGAVHYSSNTQTGPWIPVIDRRAISKRCRETR